MFPSEAPPDAFGRAAQEYELGRPEWPQELIDRVVRVLELASDARALDLGAGTGKLTRALVPRFAHVYAVEPDHAMRSVLEEVVPDAEALAGDAAAIPLDDRSVDAVFCAEAFHWFATSDAVTEISRVLRRRGALAIFWNIFEGQGDPHVGDAAVALLDEAVRKGGAPGQGRVVSGVWRRAFETAPFEPLREDEVERDIVSDREGWIASMLSVSSIAALPDEERLELGARLRELCPEGEYRRRVRTVAYWTRLA